MGTKQILFRLDDNTAKSLERKLTEKGISKQFLFSKVVDMFIDDKLSFDGNSKENNLDNKTIAIDSNVVVETIKERYLNELATLLSNDSNLVTLVADKVMDNIETAKLENKLSQSKVSNNLLDKNISKEKQKTKSKEISQLPKELISLSIGEKIAQRDLVNFTKNTRRKISSWLDEPNIRPEWFDEYIEVRIEKKKRVMYRR